MRPRLRIRPFAALLLALPASCASQGRFAAHGDARAWSGAWSGFAEDPAQYGPVLVLGAGVPAAFLLDPDIEEDAVAQHTFGTDKGTGDALAIAFGAAPILVGTATAVRGGGGRDLETAAEGLGATMALTYALKFAVHRERPDKSGNDSFPSGHTAMSFAGATWLARWLESEAGAGKWGYALYAPAAYVAISRMEGDRHYLSDTVFGALLATLTVDLVWNAHHGDEAHGRPGIWSLGGRDRLTFGSGTSSQGDFVYGLDWRF